MISGKTLISGRTPKTQQQKANNNLVKIWTKNLHIHFSKEDIHMTNKHVKDAYH